VLVLALALAFVLFFSAFYAPPSAQLHESFVEAWLSLLSRTFLALIQPS
jgi:hypothetical protein